MLLHQELRPILPQVANHRRSTSRLTGVLSQLRNQGGRAEPRSELSNSGNLAAGTRGFHEILGTTSGDSSDVAHPLVIPTPESSIVMLDLVLSRMILILSSASEEFDTSVRRKICVGAGSADDKGASSVECRHWMRRSPTWLLKTANHEEMELGTRLETKST